MQAVALGGRLDLCVGLVVDEYERAALVLEEQVDVPLDEPSALPDGRGDVELAPAPTGGAGREHRRRGQRRPGSTGHVGGLLRPSSKW